MLTDMHLDGNDDIPPKPIKRNPYGFNYHSVKSLNKIKLEGEQPLHENDKSFVRTPIKPSIKSTEKDADDNGGIPKDTNELFRTNQGIYQVIHINLDIQLMCSVLNTYIQGVQSKERTGVFLRINHEYFKKMNFIYIYIYIFIYTHTHFNYHKRLQFFHQN